MIDDGSTDDSGRLLDQAAQERDWMTVIHQENSGWAGAPRNRGIERARGEFVFFADPDDEFGTSTALSRLVEFARNNSADVVLPRVVGQGGRAYAQWRYKETQIDADLVTAFTTLTPHKLVRRQLIEDHQLRFPEEKVRLEDGIFFAEAYLRASRVSILTGEEFYLLVHHDDGGHLSKQAIDPAGYIGTSVTRICELVEQLAPADQKAPIIAELVKRKVLLGSRPKKISVYKDARIRKWMAAQRDFTRRFLTSPERWEAVPTEDRRLLEYAMDDDVDGVRVFSKFLESRISAARAEVKGPKAVFDGGQELPANAEIDFVLRNRADASQELRAESDANERGWTAEFDLAQYSGSADAKTIFDLYAVFADAHGAAEKRVAADADITVVKGHNQCFEPYSTQKGNVSVRVRPALSWGSRLKRKFASVKNLGVRNLAGRAIDYGKKKQ